MDGRRFNGFHFAVWSISGAFWPAIMRREGHSKARQFGASAETQAHRRQASRVQSEASRLSGWPDGVSGEPASQLASSNCGAGRPQNIDESFK